MLRVLSLTFFVEDIPCKLVTVNPCNKSGPEMSRALQHSHSGFEIHYVRNGHMTVDCIGESFRLSADQMLILPSGSYHYIRSISEQTDRMDMLIEIGNPQHSQNSQAKLFLEGLFCQRPTCLQKQAQPELFALLGKIRELTMDYRDDFLQREWLKVLCLELVLLMGSAVKTGLPEAEDAAYQETDRRNERYIMDNFFNHNYQGNRDMQALAKELNMSVRQTGRVLHKTYGKGFREKVNECRLAVAVDLLQNTEQSMGEISETLGYGDPANFSSFIKRQTGKTPAQIRKKK